MEWKGPDPFEPSPPLTKVEEVVCDPKSTPADPNDEAMKHLKELEARIRSQQPDPNQNAKDVFGWIIAYVVVVVVLVSGFRGCYEHLKKRERIREYERQYYENN